MKNKSNQSKNTIETKEFNLTPRQIRTDKILAIIYAIWAIANLIIFIPRFFDQHFEELFPFTTLDLQYYNFFTLIIFTFFLPELIHILIKYHRIKQHTHKKN